MNPRLSIVLVLAFVLGGCVSQSKVANPTPPSIPAPIFKLLSSGVLPPPSTNAIVLHFIYDVWPLTNGFVESSTDLLCWVVRPDATPLTNDDGTVTDWNITPTPGADFEFYRAGGETIGVDADGFNTLGNYQ